MWSFVHLIDGPSGMDIVMVYFQTEAVQMITLFYNIHICLLLQRDAVLPQVFFLDKVMDLVGFEDNTRKT